MIGDATLFAPDAEDLAGAMATFLKLLRANGGHARMGIELKRVLLEAGFSDIRAGASFESFTTAEDVRFFHGFVSGRFFAPETVDAVEKHGLASREQMDGWHRMLDDWRDAPDAMAVIAWGEATARKPSSPLPRPEQAARPGKAHGARAFPAGPLRPRLCRLQGAGLPSPALSSPGGANVTIAPRD